MKPTLLLLAVTALATGRIFAADAKPNMLTSAEKSAGWQLLFDGKSLDGWKASEDKDAFTVEDGCIVTFSDMQKAKAANWRTCRFAASLQKKIIEKLRRLGRRFFMGGAERSGTI